MSHDLDRERMDIKKRMLVIQAEIDRRDADRRVVAALTKLTPAEQTRMQEILAAGGIPSAETVPPPGE